MRRFQTEWGNRCFLDIFSAADALKAFKAALEADAEWAPAHAGVARTLADENPPAAAAAAQQGARDRSDARRRALLLAQLDLDNARYDAARERIDKVLADQPVASRCALAARRDRLRARPAAQAFDTEAKQVLAINPGVRRGLPRRRRAGRAQLPVRRGGRADAGSRRARSDEHARVSPISACT